jgi:hypothetical protein
MSHTLTRRNISAIARLEMAGLSHAQRIDEIAKAVGYTTGAAMMATLKSSEDSTSPTQNTPSDPFTLVVAFGSGICSAIGNDEAICNDAGHIEDGDLSIEEFATQAELDAYTRGMEDAEGWLDVMIVANSSNDPNHAFFVAAKENSGFTYAEWYTKNLEQSARQDRFGAELDEADERDIASCARYPGRASNEIIGYQVDVPETGENWNGRPSYEIMSLDKALVDLECAHKAGRKDFKLLIVRHGDIEESTFA